MTKYCVKINHWGEFWYKDPSHLISHRVFGPSGMYWDDGGEFWMRDNGFHRVGGPSIVYSDGNISYWLYGSDN